ncbi:alpha/beta hydrolase [Catenulispora subtropica]|uniref:Alpha/beta hydrolase n=1 Tax=Catenulispora subtropica TaxID=450798 RepID=A0ABN2SK04_9ACTN
MLAFLLKVSAEPVRPPRPPGEFIRIDGVVLHVVRSGPVDGPIVVMCSGLGGAWLSWDTVTPLLAGRCHVVRFDRPGLGWSAPDPRAPTAAREAYRMRSLLRGLGLPGPYILVGHSLGGLFGEAFARLYPELTAGLVLTESACEPVEEFGRHRELKLRAARTCGAIAQRVGASQFLGPTLRELGVRTQSRRGVETADAAHAHGAFCHGATVTAAMIERVTCYDMSAELGRLRRTHPMPDVPTYVLSATGPRSDPTAVHAWRRHQRDLAALLTAEHREIADSAHLMPIDRPDAIAAAVLETVHRGAW